MTKPLQEFLLKFQTKAPMTSFLALSLKDLLLAIMGRFLYKEVLEKKPLRSRSYLLLTLMTKRIKKTQSMLTLALLFEVL